MIYPVVKELPLPLIRNIRETSDEAHIQAGHIVFDVGEDCGFMPLLTAGSVRVVKPMQTGWEMVLYRVLPGQVCVLTATCILSGWNHLARVIAEKDLHAVSISKDSLHRLVEGSADFRSFVFSNYSISLLSMLNCMEVVLTQPVEQRLARMLLDKRVDAIGVTHQVLANELGTAREVVSRILKDFEENEMVRLKRGMILIQDREALTQTLQAACH